MFQKNFKAVVIAILLLATSSLQAQREATAWTPDQIRKLLEQRIDVEKQGIGIVVGLIDAKGSQVIGHGSLRKSNSATKFDGNSATKFDGNTVFEIGSVTKVFTSLLLADMVVRGEVALNDPASKYLPKTVTLPTREGREITLLDLATHRSALPRIPTNLSPKNGQNPYADYTVDQMYAFLSGCKLTGNIGDKVDYSNLGVGLLGHILSLRAGTDFETLIATRVCKPLEMTTTSIALTPDMLKRLVPGHDGSGNEVKNWDIPTLAGAGAIRSTVGDMLRFVEANMGKKKSSLSDAMTEQQVTRSAAESPNLSIGLGWFKLAGFGSEIAWHNGQTGGYHSFIGFDPKRGVGVVVLSNAALDIDDLGFHLLDNRYPLKKANKQRTAIQMDSKILESYVGQYELAPTFVISITKEGEQLMLQATGQPKFEVFAESETKFFLKVVDAQVSFVKDEKGTVTQLILHQGGANQPAKKRDKKF